MPRHKPTLRQKEQERRAHAARVRRAWWVGGTLFALVLVAIVVVSLL